MIKYFTLTSFLLLVGLLGNGCAIAGQRSHVTVYSNSNFDNRKYNQFYSYYSGHSCSIGMFVIDQYLEDSMPLKFTANKSESVNKLFVAYEETEGAVFPPYFSHVELYFSSIDYAKVVVLDSITKQPIMQCIYTRGFFALAGGGRFRIIMEQSLAKGFEKLEEIRRQRKKDPNTKFTDEITFTVD